MNINRKIFYDHIRDAAFQRTLNQSQVEGIEAILNEWEDRQLTDLRWLAYIFATAKWETGHTMQPIEEYGKGYGHVYGLEDPVTHKAYYGRGFVQLTWKSNYEKMAKLLGVDLVNKPELALDEDVAVQIIFEGMLKAESGIGDFTNHSLEEFFNDTREDWLHARTIVNGMDKAGEIAAIATNFYNALLAATAVS